MECDGFCNQNESIAASVSFKVFWMTHTIKPLLFHYAIKQSGVHLKFYTDCVVDLYHMWVICCLILVMDFSKYFDFDDNVVFMPYQRIPINNPHDGYLCYM